MLNVMWRSWRPHVGGAVHTMEHRIHHHHALAAGQTNIWNMTYCPESSESNHHTHTRQRVTRAHVRNSKKFENNRIKPSKIDLLSDAGPKKFMVLSPSQLGSEDSRRFPKNASWGAFLEQRKLTKLPSPKPACVSNHDKTWSRYACPSLFRMFPIQVLPVATRRHWSRGLESFPRRDGRPRQFVSFMVGICRFNGSRVEVGVIEAHQELFICCGAS